MIIQMSFRVLATVLLISAFHAISSFAQASEPLYVPLDNTGIAEWSYLNANYPAVIKQDQSLIFQNTTGDRTFIITIPVSWSTSDYAVAYASARMRRGNVSLHDIVCRALTNCQTGTSTPLPCPAEQDTLDELQGLVEVREVLTRTSTSPPDLPCDIGKPECLIEMTFWEAACAMDDNHIHAFALHRTAHEIRRYLPDAAARMTSDILSSRSTSTCTRSHLLVRDSTVARLRGEASVPDQRFPLDRMVATQDAAIATQSFERERSALAKAFLLDHINTRIDSRVKEVSLLIKTQEERRQELDERRRRAREVVERNHYRARLREIDASQKLLQSYASDAVAPYTSIPQSLLALSETNRCETDSRFYLRQEGGDESTRWSRQSAVDSTEIANCKRSEGRVNCELSLTVPPYQSVTADPDDLKFNPEPRIEFKVRFFDETDPPANPVGHVVREGREKQARPEGRMSFGFGAATALNYDLDANLTSHRRYAAGSGTFTMQYSGPFDVAATLRLKAGAFGDVETTRDVIATQYQGRVFGPAGFVLQFGRFTFARPSAGIALNETGEGLRLAWQNLAASYIIRRESDDPGPRPNERDEDAHLLLLQANNVPLSYLARSLDLTFAWGEEKRNRRQKSDTDPPEFEPLVPYTYATLGFETRVGVPVLRSLTGSVAAYHSIRRTRLNDEIPPDHHRDQTARDGNGTVGLVAMNWSRSIRLPPGTPGFTTSPSVTFSVLVGAGTGDDPDTDRDEGYVGETASFANDMIFLSTISTSPSYERQLGRGLANKRYGGAQWSDGRFSPLALLARLFQAESEVTSRATILSLHFYQLEHPIGGERDGGVELNVRSQLESPKNVQWHVAGAYFSPGPAIENVGIIRDQWMFLAGVTINIAGAR